MAEEIEVVPVVKEETSKEQSGVFDPSKKKKKKKVRVEADDEATTSEVAEKLDTLSVSEPSSESFGLKKKPKKKKPVEGQDEGEAGPEEKGGEEGIVGEGAGEAEGGEEIKRRKKPPRIRPADEELPPEADALDEEDPLHEPDDDEDEEAEAIDLTPRLPWEGTDRDYHYEELLDRVFHILRENNPELAGEKRRTIIRPPQVLREGTKKTVFVNLMDLCKTMHRQPDHVMAFLLAELGTSGSLDGQQRLVVKGRFVPKNFEGILRRYINEYVICGGCKSPDTILTKENRLNFLRCEQCGSHRSVAPIKAGFVARVGRRTAARG